MLIKVNTDNNINGHERLEDYVTEQLQHALKKFDERITRLEVHLGDENSTKFGTKDKRCMIEARPAGLKPVAIEHHADTIEKAISGASDKIKSVLEHTFGKLSAH